MVMNILNTFPKKVMVANTITTFKKHFDVLELEGGRGFTDNAGKWDVWMGI